MRAGSMALLVGLVAIAGCAPVPGPATENAAPLAAQAAVDQLLAADRASGSSDSAGLSHFAAMFDEEVVLFAAPVPGFARGRQQAVATLAQALGGEAGLTRWAPIRGGISADGRHGFTFGYMTTTQAGEAPKLAKYVAYWIRRPEGWRVALFKRVPRPDGEVSLEMMPPALPPRFGVSSAGAAAQGEFRDSLERREIEFSDQAQRIGLGPAFARFGSADAVNVGGGTAFVVGAENIGATQDDGGPSPLLWAPDQGVLVASSGDLGVTWGFLRRNGPTPPGRLSEIPFFTIWRRDSPRDPWLYVAE